MNSITIVLSVVMVVLCTSTNAKTYAGVFRHPEHPGKCHLGDGMVLEEGQTITQHNGECLSITCFENEHASIRHCVPQKMRDGCVEGDIVKPEAPFPECCKRAIKCKDHYYSD